MYINGQKMTAYGNFTGTDRSVLYTEQELSEEQKAQARKNIGAAAQKQGSNVTPEMYFDIDDNGVIALKAEYRGASTKTTLPLSISDNGAGKAGSKNAELPEHIIIPDVVREIPVNALADAMFRTNLAVKEITIPVNIKTIPNTFAYEAKSLREIHGTENIETIAVGAFYRTAITKAIFPNLKSIDSVQHFTYCTQLLVADIGNTITNIPNNSFRDCSKLHTIRNGGNVTTVGDYAFYGTHRLKTPTFAPNLTKIGKSAFVVSRANSNWVTQLNPTDYWSNCTFEECNTPLLSTFDQENPLWVNTVIDSTGRKFSDGCIMVGSAVIYSALKNQEFSSPVEFLELVRETDPALLEQNTGNTDNWTAPLRALGLVCSENLYYNEANLQTMYNALANGSLVMSSMYHGETQAHAVVFHGINANGEVLVCDSMTQGKEIGIYEADRYAIPIQNIANTECVFTIISNN